MPSSRTTLLEDPDLRPFLPLLWIAWSDGDLEASDLEGVRRHIEEMPWLRPAARIALAKWLDRDVPPTRAEMNTLLETIGKVAGTLTAERQRDLVELGLSMAPDGAANEDTRKAIRALEEALCGSEGAAEPIFRNAFTPSTIIAPPPFDVPRMRARLDAPHAPLRDRVRAFLDDPDKRAYGLPTPEYRAKVAGWLAALAEEGLGAHGYPGVTTDAPDLQEFIGIFETLAFGDLSLVVRLGVQFGLFGGSIFFLGTEAQKKTYLPRVARLELPGCFAMSEVGHGSDVQSLETEATWDPATRTFDVFTPRESARKDWIGGAAQHARLATVFARLKAGGEDHAIHAFLVPLRDEQGNVLPNVRTGDSGHKMGLNGVDNGRLWFDHVTIPEDAMLGRFASFSESGDYQSPIANPSKRFFTMLGTLVGGRISVACASVSAAKVGLTIAVRYAASRRQFGSDDGIEVPLLSYPTHKRRLLPHLATTYVLSLAVRGLRERFGELQRAGEGGGEPADSRAVEASAAALKALASDHAVDTLASCRRACGGQGYLSVNRLPQLMDDTEIFTTFEGDNTVLYQLVAKSLLAGFKKRFESAGTAGILRHVMGKAKREVVEKNLVAVRLTSPSHLRDRDFHLAALRYREEALLESASARLRKRIAEKLDAHTAMLEVQEHLVALARAHADRIALEWFDEQVKQEPDPETRAWLDRLGALHALTRIRDEAAFYLSEGYIDANKESAMRRETEALLGEIHDGAVGLVDAFGIPDTCLAAPIAFMDPAHPKWP